MKKTVNDIIREFGTETDYKAVGRRLALMTRRVFPQKFYILDFNNPLKPIPFGRYFESYDQAYRYIDSFLNGKHNLFIIFKGERLVKFIRIFKLNPTLTKYQYKKGASFQDKKSYRTKLRRQLRSLQARELKEWQFNKKVDRNFLPKELRDIMGTPEGRKKIKTYLELTRKKYYRSLS